MLEKLYRDIGREHDLAQTSRALREVVRGLSPNGVGAMHVTCADETEHEVAAAFQQVFTRDLLPRLKYGSHVPLRLANPGARYEWGGVGLTEAHYATPETLDGFKVLVVKINGHVAVTKSGTGLQFGSLARYGVDSAACGAVDAVLQGSDLPFALDLRDDLLSGGQDRLAALRDPERVDPALRHLVGALVLARLQARWATLEIQDHLPQSPTIYLVLHGVTLNVPGPDRELLGGVYLLDRRGAKAHDRYRGLGDDPALYEVSNEAGRVQVSDPQIGQERAARDHRAMAAARLQGTPLKVPAALRAQVAPLAEAHKAGRPIDKGLLAAALTSLATLDPLPVALLLVARGVAGIHHARQLEQAVDKKTQALKAHGVLAAVRERLLRLPPEAAADVAASLL